MSSPELDAVIVGAGAAGLAALSELERGGLNALCLEARDRIGGRIFTLRDPLCALPVELGAEFIHGRPPEIWDIIQAAQLTAYDAGDVGVRVQNGKVSDKDAWHSVREIMEDMQHAAEQGNDQTFSEFLNASTYPDDAKRLAANYVEGFNAARKEAIGIASLAQDERAAGEIDGDNAFRLIDGYASVALHLLRSVPNGQLKLRLNSVVESIGWQRGSASVRIRNAITGHLKNIRAARVVITVPLGVLQAEPPAEGAIAFQPEPAAVLKAARQLAFGHVIRVILRFREAFWESNKNISFAGFLLSDERLFPTWWTPLAVHGPFITGWSAGPHADDLIDQPRAVVLAHALGSLARITGTSAAQVNGLLEAAYFHDWQADPFARGAYSYVPAGALTARETLAQPVSDTLYFAGEATELRGHSATVHGAIASGKRAAQQILAAHARR